MGTKGDDGDAMAVDYRYCIKQHRPIYYMFYLLFVICYYKYNAVMHYSFLYAAKGQ